MEEGARGENQKDSMERTQPGIAHFEECHELRNMGGFKEYRYSRESPQVACRPADTLILAQWDSFEISDLPNCQIVN